jgi:hypothetical protein
LLQLLRARLARLKNDVAAADRAAAEGLHLAGRAGLGLYQIELLCERAELQHLQNDPAAADTARQARDLALASSCRFLWGAAEASHLLGRILVDHEQFGPAREVLEKTLQIRRRLGDAQAWQTEELLRRSAQ